MGLVIGTCPAQIRWLLTIHTSHDGFMPDLYGRIVWQYAAYCSAAMV